MINCRTKGLTDQNDQLKNNMVKTPCSKQALGSALSTSTITDARRLCKADRKDPDKTAGWAGQSIWFCCSRDWMHSGFLPFFTRETTSVTSCLFSRTLRPIWKGVYSKTLPQRANSFLLDYAPVDKGGKPILTELPPLPWKCTHSP